MLDRVFQLSHHGTTIGRELLAGLTTFLTMAYIVVVHPAVLSTDFEGNPTGLDAGAVLLATCLASSLATLIMGLYARYPIALAPGMGQNFFFVSVIATLATKDVPDPWRVALGIVFVAGVIFLALSLFGVREAILNSVSPGMRNAIAAGIGLFIAFIGLKNGGVITDSPATLVQLNYEALWSAQSAVFWLGLLVAAVLHTRRIPGSILWGIVAAGALAAAMGKLAWPDALFGLPRIEQSAVFQMDIAGALSLAGLPFIFVFLYMDLFDTTGTLIGVAEQAGFLDGGKLPRARQAFTADAVGTVAGACLGTSTITSFIESVAGVEQGGRTGLTAVVVAVLFLLALLFSPLIAVIGDYPAITAPALVLVGSMMVRNATRIDWHDPSEATPALLIVLGIPLCYSIADGLALGLIAYPIVKFLGGKAKETTWTMYLLAAVLLVYLLTLRMRIGG